MNGHIVQWVGILWAVGELGLALWKRSAGTATKRDVGSLPLLWLTITAGIFAGAWLRNVPAGSIAVSPRILFALSLAFIVSGIILRIAAISTLKQSFTVDVAVRPDQQLIRHGLYRFVRHPSYSGMLLAFLGLATGMGNWLSVAAVMIPITLALVYRVRVEERALREAFGSAYDDYARTTKRLIPWLL
jgi:protein-S-isoprenylcysteine O-methyltransferase